MKKLSLTVIGLGFLAGIYAFSNKAVAETVCTQYEGFGEICETKESYPEETKTDEDFRGTEARTEPIEEPVVEPAPTCQ